MKFCTNCGKELENEICSCEGDNKSENTEPKEPKTIVKEEVVKIKSQPNIFNEAIQIAKYLLSANPTDAPLEASINPNHIWIVHSAITIFLFGLSLRILIDNLMRQMLGPLFTGGEVRTFLNWIFMNGAINGAVIIAMATGSVFLLYSLFKIPTNLLKILNLVCSAYLLTALFLLSSVIVSLFSTIGGFAISFVSVFFTIALLNGSIQKQTREEGKQISGIWIWGILLLAIVLSFPLSNLLTPRLFLGHDEIGSLFDIFFEMLNMW